MLLIPFHLIFFLFEIFFSTYTSIQAALFDPEMQQPYREKEKKMKSLALPEFRTERSEDCVALRMHVFLGLRKHLLYFWVQKFPNTPFLPLKGPLGSIGIGSAACLS